MHVINSLYTEWSGDAVHGRRPVYKPYRVDLSRLYAPDPSRPRHVVPDGLDLTGTVEAALTGWFPGAAGSFLGVVQFALSYADGRPDTIHVVDQLVPDYMIRQNGKAGSP